MTTSGSRYSLGLLVIHCAAYKSESLSSFFLFLLKEGLRFKQVLTLMT